jgi:solute carrier family 35 protein C2
MGDDPTHRRRSASIVHAAGGKHMASSKGGSKSKHGYRQSSLSLGTNGTIDPKSVIHEDSDPAPSSSDLEMNDMRSDDEVNEMTDDEETGLTQAERKKRRRRKRRSTMLDERVAASGGNGNGNMGDLKRIEEELAKANLVRMYGV